MPRSRCRIFDSAHPHFLTGTIVGWLAVFSFPETVESSLDSWRFLQCERGFEISGAVILENHGYRSDFVCGSPQRKQGFFSEENPLLALRAPAPRKRS